MLDPALRNEPDFTEFKLKLKEKLKPKKFKHFHCGFKYPNTLHTQLRVGRSYLNCHLFPIGLSITKSCQCGHHLESVEHYFLDCRLYDHAGAQLVHKFCCVGRNHTSLKNTCITSTYFLQSKPLLVDPRECSLMNLTNLIITMMAHTDYSINNFLLFSSSYSLPAFSAFSFSLFCDFSCL